jgi:hypothetical protein
LVIVIIFGEEYNLRSYSLCSFLQPRVTSSLFGPNILLSALFSNQRICPGPRPFVTFHNKLIFYGEELLVPRPTPKLQDHPLSAVHNCLFNIFAATLLIWRLSPPSATWGRVMPWWQGTHLTWQGCRQF